VRQSLLRETELLSINWYEVCVVLSLIQRTSEKGSRGEAVGRGTALQVGRSRVRFPMGSLEFFTDSGDKSTMYIKVTLY